MRAPLVARIPLPRPPEYGSLLFPRWPLGPAACSPGPQPEGSRLFCRAQGWRKGLAGRVSGRRTWRGCPESRHPGFPGLLRLQRKVWVPFDKNILVLPVKQGLRWFPPDMGAPETGY